MNPTSLEYLYQIAPPVPDRTPTTNRGDDDSTGFDNHLSQAASSVFDISRPPSRSASSSSYSPARRSTADNDDTSPNDSAARSTISKPPQKDQPTNDSTEQSNSTQANNTPNAASRDDDRDAKHDQDKSDDAPVAAAAGAAQPAAQDAAKPATDSSKDAEQSAADQGKDKIASDELSKVPGSGTKTQSAVDTKAKAQSNESTAELTASVEAAKTGQVATTAATGAADATQKKGDATAKTAKTAARSAKAVAGTTANDSARGTSQESNASQSAAAGSGTASAATASATATTQAAADESQSAGQSKAASESAAVSETNHSHKDAATDNAQTGTVATPTPTSATSAVANITVQTPVDSGADKPKQSDGDAAKPIEAKTDTPLGALGRTLRTDLSGSSETSKSSEPSPVDVTRFVSRVAKAVQTASDRDGVVQLRLSPPELGSLKIQLTVKDGVMSAALEADNSNARRMLLDHLPALRDRLADQNIRVDRFDVDVKQENNGGQANPRGFNQNPYQQQTQDNETRRTAAVKTPQINESSPAETAVAIPRDTSNGINLVI